jgi:hypothetical protein
LRAAAYAEFFVGVLQMMLNGPRREHELAGDLVAAEPAAGQHRHLALARSQGRGPGGRDERGRAGALALAGQGVGADLQRPGLAAVSGAAMGRSGGEGGLGREQQRSAVLEPVRCGGEGRRVFRDGGPRGQGVIRHPWAFASANELLQAVGGGPRISQPRQVAQQHCRGCQLVARNGVVGCGEQHSAGPGQTVGRQRPGSPQLEFGPQIPQSGQLVGLADGCLRGGGVPEPGGRDGQAGQRGLPGAVVAVLTAAGLDLGEPAPSGADAAGKQGPAAEDQPEQDAAGERAVRVGVLVAGGGQVGRLAQPPGCLQCPCLDHDMHPGVRKRELVAELKVIGQGLLSGRQGGFTPAGQQQRILVRDRPQHPDARIGAVPQWRHQVQHGDGLPVVHFDGGLDRLQLCQRDRVVGAAARRADGRQSGGGLQQPPGESLRAGGHDLRQLALVGRRLLRRGQHALGLCVAAERVARLAKEQPRLGGGLAGRPHEPFDKGKILPVARQPGGVKQHPRLHRVPGVQPPGGQAQRILAPPPAAPADPVGVITQEAAPGERGHLVPQHAAEHRMGQRHFGAPAAGLDADQPGAFGVLQGAGAGHPGQLGDADRSGQRQQVKRLAAGPGAGDPGRHHLGQPARHRQFRGDAPYAVARHQCARRLRSQDQLT